MLRLAGHIRRSVFRLISFVKSDKRELYHVNPNHHWCVPYKNNKHYFEQTLQLTILLYILLIRKYILPSNVYSTHKITENPKQFLSVFVHLYYDKKIHPSDNHPFRHRPQPLSQQGCPGRVSTLDPICTQLPGLHCLCCY